MKGVKYFAIAIIGLLILSELIFRIAGVGNPPVFIEDSDYEYIYAPKQDIFRFGNRILTNSLSMRSDEPDTSAKIRIMGLGDSVINGGSWVDHDSLATSRLQRMLEDSLHESTQLLNVSAGSWGPDNCAEYLRKHGHFGVNTIILVTSGHDVADVMTFDKKVGVQIDYPSKPYFLGWMEIYDKYIKNYWRWISIIRTDKEMSNLNRAAENRSEVLNPGYQQILKYCNNNSVKLLVVVHPERDELKSKMYGKGGEWIKKWCLENKIPFIDGMYYMNNKCYMDMIHLNEYGQGKLATCMRDLLIINGL